MPRAFAGLAGCAAALLAAACGATPNPTRGELPAAAAPPFAGGALAVGRVGERELPVEDFLARLWVRENAVARDVLEQLVLAELALREAARLGLSIDPARVQALLDASEATLGERLAAAPSPLTVDEHIRRNLELDPAFYRRQLRSDAVVQLVAERCVRAFTLGSPRARVRILDLDQAGAEAAGAALAAGESFEAVAARHGGAEEVVLVRSEGNELSRLAFASEPGQVAGPLVREGHFVLLQVEALEEPLEGGWERVGPEVEASLAADPVGDREFVQWRYRMVERYAVDLGPFLDLVGDPGP